MCGEPGLMSCLPPGTSESGCPPRAETSGVKAELELRAVGDGSVSVLLIDARVAPASGWQGILFVRIPPGQREHWACCFLAAHGFAQIGFHLSPSHSMES